MLAAALAIGAAIFAATALSGALALPAQPAPPGAPEVPNRNPPRGNHAHEFPAPARVPPQALEARG